MGGDPHALRINDIAGLYADMKITPCPSPVPAVARSSPAFRGEVVPVYDLAALLGYPHERQSALAGGRRRGPRRVRVR